MAADETHEKEPAKTAEHEKDPGQEKPRSERATHQGGANVNKDHKPHGGGPVPTGKH
jgi:hypothetical protein